MNKVAVISGGTKGIGRAAVVRFASEGYDIITCARKEEDLTALKDVISQEFEGVAIHIFKADLSIKSETLAFVAFVLETSKQVDVLINNTGTFIPGSIHQEEEGNLELMINTNLYSAYHLTRGLVNHMIQRQEGDVFNICSIASIKAYPNGGSYSISKFAMYGMSQGLREELKPHGVRVVAILPGATLTASWEGVDLPEDRFMKPEDIANSIWAAHRMSKNTVVEDIVLRPQLGDI